MKQFLLLSAVLLLLLSVFSCSEDIAEDGTKRGTLFYVGNVQKNGKEYTVFIYNRGETIESADMSSETFWYWLTYTVDAKSGKIVHQTSYDVDDNSGNFMGISDTYAFFWKDGGVTVIDLHADNSIIGPSALKKMIGKKNEVLKGRIALMETNGNSNFVVTTTLGDIYLLNPNSLKGRPITDELELDPDYQFKLKLPDYGNSTLINGRIHGYILSDTTTLALEAYDPNNTHKHYLYKLRHPSRENFYEMVSNMTQSKLDSTVFLDASILGYKDSVILVEYLSALGNTGKKKMGSYSLKTKKYLWSKPAASLYTHEGDGSYYTLYWNTDGNSFFIYAQENGYSPVSLVNAKTGKIVWKF